MNDPRKLAEDYIAYHEGRGDWPVQTPHMDYSIALARKLLKALDKRDIAKEQHANTLNRLLSERAERDRRRGFA
jgi:hypothetical protein